MTQSEHHTSSKLSYQEALTDRRWRELRDSILERDQYRCRSCGTTGGLHVHHRQYQRFKTSGEWKKPWEYPDYLLVTLCRVCHEIGHQKFPVPIKEI